jgi:hypothetical protein
MNCPFSGEEMTTWGLSNNPLPRVEQETKHGDAALGEEVRTPLLS